MSREPIYPTRYTLCAQVPVQLAAALTDRARHEQVPKRVVIEAALRAYLSQPGVPSRGMASERWVSVAEAINIQQLADDVSEDCGTGVKGGSK